MKEDKRSCWITDKMLTWIAERSKGYDIICERCKQNNVSVDDVDWDPTVKKYIACVQTFDRTLRQKLAVNYQKICEIAKTEYSKTVLRWLSCELFLKTEYNNWLKKFEGVRKARYVDIVYVPSMGTTAVFFYYARGYYGRNSLRR